MAGVSQNAQVGSKARLTRYAMRKRFGSIISAAPLLLLMIGFLLVPLSFILWGSFEGTKFNLAHYHRVVTSPNSVNILLHTLKIGAWVTLISLVVGYPIAYFLTKVKPLHLSVMSIFILIPLFTAFLIRTYAWTIILGREGIINKALIWMGLIDGPIQLLNSTFAVLVGMTHVFIPMAIFTMYSSMARIEHSYAHAAQILGANPVQSFLRVYLPMTMPGLMSAGILIFISAIGFYITPALLGGPSDTMISQLIVDQMTTLLNFELGFASAITLLVVILAILFIASLFVPIESIWTSAASVQTSKPRAVSRVIASCKRFTGSAMLPIERFLYLMVRGFLTRDAKWLWAYTVLVLFFLTAPLIVVVILSFSSSPFVVFPPPGFSLRWWEKLAMASDWHTSFAFSIQLGLASACIATVIGTMGAFWLVRAEFMFKRAIFLLCLLPLIVPVVIIATALYVFEAKLRILGSFGGMVIGHVLLSVPYVIVIMSAALRNFDTNLEPAAAVHGAKPLQTLRLVTVPLLKPALLTAALLAFLTSFDELLVSKFLLGRQTQTLPIKFWSDIKYQIDPLLSTASTLIVLLVTVAIVSLQVMRLRQVRRTALSSAE